MTIREVTIATGASSGTINNHVRRGGLPATWDTDGKRWSIGTHDAMTWADQEWRRGRITMFPPSHIRQNIHLLQDLRTGKERIDIP